MNALTLLKADHDKVKKLLDEGESTTERGEKTRTELFATLKAELTIHERIDLFTLRNHLLSGDEVLRTLRHPARKSGSRMACAEAGRGLLSNLQNQLSSGNKILRTLRNPNHPLRHFQLFL